jgi:coronin-1B/1C/6
MLCSDIYPPCFSGESSLTAEAWFGGENAEPKSMDLEALYVADGGAPDPTPKTPATPSTSTPSAPKTTSVVATGPPPAKTTITPPKPVPAPEISKAPSSPVKETLTPTPAAKDDTPKPILIEESAKVADKIPDIPNPPLNLEPTKPPTPSAISPPATPAVDNSKIEEQLAHITTLLEQQNKQLVSQNEHIAELTKEVDTLRGQVNANAKESEESSRKDEIIRKLELELEEARS